TPRSDAYFASPLAQGTPGKQCGLAATGDYQPSLRSPWLAANAGKATINGLEVNLDFRPTPRDLIFLGYGYANTYGQEAFLIQDGTIQTRNSISDNAASHTFSILGSHRFDSGIQISSAYYYVGEMVWSGEGDLVPTFRRWDVRLGKQFTLPGMDGEIALIGQNLNGGHVDFFNAPNRDLVNRWETRFFLQASLGFR
ncbi:MAG: TonB-dependent receptor, partial [gamma proteobacterium endosymbiont of Lamellibrachia anaximandri]|nr:TonB-dependent receptor [gamma proteobacterium endosymbiont of Lamellibrachia anaximandri]